MSKLAIVLIGFAVAGCASTGAWRATSLDGSSETALDDSVARLGRELPFRKAGQFALALQDIWITRVVDADRRGAQYTDADYRAELDGKRYDDVIALADEAGPSIYARYFYANERVGSPPALKSQPVPEFRGFLPQNNARYGWGTSTLDSFDPSPNGWRPSP
jgi:hypothetical protein